MRQIVESGDVGMDRDVGQLRLDVVEFLQPDVQTVLVADHAGVLGHQVAHRALQVPHGLRAAGAQHRVDLLAGIRYRGGAALLGKQAIGVGGRGPAHDLSVHQQLDERIAAQPVGPVQTARGLAHRVQAHHVGAVVLGAYPHTTHRVVGRRCDLHRRGGDVEQLQFHERLVDARQALHDLRAGQV